MPDRKLVTLFVNEKKLFFRGEGQILFGPVQVHFQLTDLAVKLSNQVLVILFFSFSPVAEQIHQTP